MALSIGDAQATSGMTKAVFDRMDAILMTVEEKAALKPADLEKIRQGWKKLAFAFSSGLVDYLRDNLEVIDVTVTGNVNLGVAGTLSGSAVTGSAAGAVTLSQAAASTGGVQ